MNVYQQYRNPAAVPLSMVMALAASSAVEKDTPPVPEPFPLKHSTQVVFPAFRLQMVTTGGVVPAYFFKDLCLSSFLTCNHYCDLQDQEYGLLENPPLIPIEEPNSEEPNSGTLTTPFCLEPAGLVHVVLQGFPGGPLCQVADPAFQSRVDLEP